MIVLVRHASTDWSGVRYCGLADPPLSDAGRREASAVAERLVALIEPGTRILSSPRRRALDTANAIARAAGAQEPDVDDRWQEVDVGGAEGLTFDEIEARWPDLAGQLASGATDIAWPEGDPAGALTARVASAWSELQEAAGTTVVVTHGGPIGVALDLALGRGAARPFLKPGAFVRLRRAAAVRDGLATFEEAAASDRR